jgi:hypothetical protein
MTTSKPASAPFRKSSPIFTIAWVLLLIIAAFTVLSPLFDFVADARTGLPSDHLGAFSNIAGVAWQTAQQSSPGITQYITWLEVAYAVHELVYGILFLLILAIPFRQGARWAWWACWAVLLANLTYTITFGAHDPTILIESLTLDILIPVLLLVQIPRFFGRQQHTSAGS